MKQCDLCGKAEAKMKVSQLDKDGKMTELAICADCARKRGLSEVEKGKPGAAEILAELKARVEDADVKIVCRRCGMTYAEFKRLGRVGCADCYVAFHNQLLPLIRRIHGAGQHVGKSTKGGRKQAHERMNAERLKDALATAVKDEDYEKAAALRDQLRQGGDNEAGK
jgi:protein arginine kinase activator